jgi:hypothetical protein
MGVLVFEAKRMSNMQIHLYARASNKFHPLSFFGGGMVEHGCYLLQVWEEICLRQQDVVMQFPLFQSMAVRLSADLVVDLLLFESL